MLDSFEIVTTTGVVLWRRSYAFVSPAVVNRFINDVFVEESAPHAKEDLAQAGIGIASGGTSPTPYLTDQYGVKWAFVKELGLIFCAVYKSLLHLSWIDKLVENIKTIFVKLYGDQLTRPNTTIVECTRFDDYFDQQLNELEGGGGSFRKEKTVQVTVTAADDIDVGTDTAADSPDTSRPATPSSGIAHSTSALLSKQISGPGGKVSRRSRKAKKAAATATATPSYSSDESAVRKKKPVKRGRKWGADGMAEEEDPDLQLDYSATDKTTTSSTGATTTNLEHVDASTWGNTNRKGQFVLKDLDDEVHSILASADAQRTTTGLKKMDDNVAANGGGGGGGNSGLLETGLSAVGGLFRNVVGGKTLTRADLAPAMKGMEEHLLRKNVAREAAVRLCESVEADLVGVKTGSFERIQTRVRTALEAALTKMLTPTSSLDLLREIDAVTAPPATSLRRPRPYVLSIVGVNGVGKSTNLSKICYFLLQNRYRVLVVAGDTFRSGAVEQLAVHVRNLSELTQREGGHVELYQRGYGKDAAAVAKDAVAYAADPSSKDQQQQQPFDVVLIDTAGRRHNDQRLMSSLEKFAKFAQPDKILMVGEALVGTDSVAQARSFNAAFGAARSLDGFIISKCDTVGNMVGTLVSLVHATNVPILFVGVGQHYSDLRNFSVKWAVDRLLSND